MQEKYEHIINKICTELMLPGGELEAGAIRWIQGKVRKEKAAYVEVVDSGSGMRAESYDEPFTEFIRDYVWYWLTRQGYDPIIRDQDGCVDDGFADLLCDSDASEYAFSDYMAAKPFPRIQVVPC